MHRVALRRVSPAACVLALAAGVVLALGQASGTAAFIIDRTPTGADLRWLPASMPIPYVINERTAPVSGGAEAIRAAFGTWQAVPGAALSFADGGATAQTTARNDATNLILWRTSNLDPDKFDPQTLAVTTMSFQAASGAITDADIEFNGRDFPWGVSREPDRMDVESVALHEIGHLLGFGHTLSRAAVMYPALRLGAQKRALSPDDINAVRTNYPDAPRSGPLPSPSPPPRPAPPPSTEARPLPRLLLLGPPNRTRADPALRSVLVFRWTPIPGAAAYFVEHGGAGLTFRNPNGTEPDSTNGFGGAGGGLALRETSLTVSLDPATPLGTYEWRVLALRPDGTAIAQFSDAAQVTLGPQAMAAQSPITGVWDLIEEACCGFDPEERLGLSFVQHGTGLAGTWAGLPITGTVIEGRYEFSFGFDAFTHHYVVTVDGPDLVGAWGFTDARSGYRSPARSVRGTRR